MVCTKSGCCNERIGAHTDEPDQVVIGIETDRGLLVNALVAAGYQVIAVSPMSVDRYRDGHGAPAPSSPDPWRPRPAHAHLGD